MAYKTTDTETQRLEELHRYAILDTPPELAFDELTRLASKLCATPIALVSLTDKARHWFKSRVGMPLTEIPRDRAFCAEGIAHHEVMIIEDTLADSRFADHPLVTGDRGIRFYAGSGLHTPNGFALGTLCVLDCIPRRLTQSQRETLELLARQVSQLLESRRISRELADSEARYSSILDRVGDALFSVDAYGRLTYASSSWPTLMGRAAQSSVGTALLDHFSGAARQAIAQMLIDAQARDATTIDVEHTREDGTRGWLHVVATAAGGTGVPGSIIGRLTDISRTKDIEHQSRLDLERLRRQTLLFEKTQGAAQIGGWELDIDTAKLFWTQETYRIHGLTSAEYNPSVDTAIDFYAPLSRPKIRAAVEAAIASGAPYDLELELLTADCRQRWVRSRGYREDANGAPRRLYGTFQDITERRSLEQSVLATAQQERDRLGDELHEGIAQELTGTALLLRAITGSVQMLDPTLAKDLEYATELINHSLESCRALAHQMTPASPTRGGLESALRTLGARTERVSGVPVQTILKVRRDVPLDAIVSDSLYGIAQEALTNAVTHSGATAIRVELSVRPDAVRLGVVDNGRGMDTTNSHPGMGIRIMHHRARLIDARLDIVSDPGRGTSIACVLKRLPAQKQQ